MSQMGHERRALLETAARRFPLYPVSDQGNAAAQYVAKGQGTKSLRSSPLVPWRFLDAGELGLPSLLVAGVRGRYRDCCQVEFLLFVSRWHESVLEVRRRGQARALPRAPSGDGA